MNRHPGPPHGGDGSTWDRLGLAMLAARGCGCMLLLYIIMGLAIGGVALLGLFFR